jgi:PRTRC genetic system protein E
MFFTALQPLLSSCASLNVMLVQNEDGTINVTVIPKSKKDGENQSPLQTPLSLVGNADELDQEFMGIITSYSSKRTSLAEQLEATEAIMDAAKKESAAKATKVVKKGASPAKVDSTSPESGDGEDDESNGGASASGSVEAGKVASSTATQPAAADNIWEA